MNRRTFLKRTAALGGLATIGPLHALGARSAFGATPPRITGYGPLVPKGDLALPAEFNYQVISRQGWPMSDGQLTPGIFDGMGAFRGARGRTVLVRNHENREQAGEIKVFTGQYEYDPQMFGGNTKLEIRRRRAGRDPISGQRLYTYTVVRDFAILGGTSTNCAGGVVGRSWIACEEVVKRGPSGFKHGYTFEIPSDASGPVQAMPIIATGRFVHEAVTWSGGVLYLTEDRRAQRDPLLGEIGGCFYRYIPDDFTPDDGYDEDDGDDRRGDDDREPGRLRSGPRPRRLSETTGKLQALKVRTEWHANMEVGRVVGRPYKVEWVDVPEADHDDDTDNRTDRVPGFTPTRIQAQDRGAAYFEKMEGMWADERRGDADDASERARRVYFACSDGGALNLGAVWEYDPERETLTMIYESVDPARLEHPDNVVIIPHTGDVLLQEDGEGDQFVRGVTQEGEIYDFCQTLTNHSEFCGGCFDPDGHTLYLNQQGERGNEPDGPPDLFAVTYAIYGPFRNRRAPGS
jgi:secreted PhoX family phosphatase